MDGRPVWQADYAAFMAHIGFKTKLCKPRHPFTRARSSGWIRFVKGNFLAGGSSYSATDLNAQALEWCAWQSALAQGGRLRPRRRALLGVRAAATALAMTHELALYPVPPPSHKLRRVRQPTREGGSACRTGTRAKCRVSRDGEWLHIYPTTSRESWRHTRDMEPQGQLLRRPVRRHAAGRTADGPRGDRHRPAGALKGKPGFDKFDFEEALAMDEAKTQRSSADA